jgi:hypothetical protein
MFGSIRQEAEFGADHWPYGVRLFDNMTWQQQLAVLAEVGEALLYEQIAIPPLVAWNEATIAAIFENIVQSIVVEMDTYEFDMADEGDGKQWRQLVLEALPEDCREPELVAGQPVPAEYDEKEFWQQLVESISAGILWDADYDDDEACADSPPRTRELLGVVFGIDEDYFIAIPPDPRKSDLPGIYRRLKRLTAGT